MFQDGVGTRKVEGVRPARTVASWKGNGRNSACHHLQVEDCVSSYLLFEPTTKSFITLTVSASISHAPAFLGLEVGVKVSGRWRREPGRPRSYCSNTRVSVQSRWLQSVLADQPQKSNRLLPGPSRDWSQISRDNDRPEQWTKGPKALTVRSWARALYSRHDVHQPARDVVVTGLDATVPAVVPS